jgi:hypothetical protein
MACSNDCVRIDACGSTREQNAGSGEIRRKNERPDGDPAPQGEFSAGDSTAPSGPSGPYMRFAPGRAWQRNFQNVIGGDQI